MKKTHYYLHHHNHNNNIHHHHHHNNHHCQSFSSPLWCRLCLRSFGNKIRHFPSSRLVTFQHKVDFQPRRLSSFLKKKKEIMFVSSKTCSVSSYCPHIPTQHRRGILNRNLFLVYPWPYIKYANIYDTPKCFLFLVTNLTAIFCVFFYFYAVKYMGPFPQDGNWP